MVKAAIGNSGQLTTARKKSTRVKKKRKGGWREGNTLPWHNVKEIGEVAHRASYNVLLHIMPVAGNDAERKRDIARKVAHLGQHLHRRGQEHVGTMIYEKKLATDEDPAVDLHGHHLCRIDPANTDILDKYDGYVVRAELIPRSKLVERVAYCTKQRAALPPELEERVKQTHPRMPGAPIRGPRFTHTRGARQILLDREHERAMVRERAVTSFQSPAVSASITNTRAIAPIGQLELFALTQPVRLRDYHGGVMSNSVGLVIEFKRKQHGLTQEQLGRIAGISQPTLANAIRGRFPLSEWAANRIREVLAA